MPAPEESYELDRDCPLCIHCGDTGKVFGHADDCTDDLCALNGDMHSCADCTTEHACKHRLDQPRPCGVREVPRGDD